MSAEGGITFRDQFGTFEGTLDTLVIRGLTPSKPLLLDTDNKVTSGDVDLVTQTTGTLPVTRGGTNSTAALMNGRLMQSTGGAIVEGTSATDPSFTSVTVTGAAASMPVKTDAAKQLTTGQIGLTSEVAGVLPVANGGTNSAAALVNGAIMVSQGGQIVEGISATTPLFTTVTATGQGSFGSLKITGATAVLGTPTLCLTYDSKTQSVATAQVDTANTTDSVVMRDSAGQVAATTLSLTGNIVMTGAGATNPNTGWTFGDLGTSGFASMGNTAIPPTMSNYALSQNSFGDTLLNCHGAMTLKLCTGGTTRMQLSGTNITVADGNAVTLNGATTLSMTTGAFTTGGQIRATATTNQLRLGTTNTVTVTSPAPAASRVVTIPDPGANASFVMTEGAQTVNGAKTLSAITTVSNATESTSSVTGALVVTGGLGIGGRVYMAPGKTLNLYGTQSIEFNAPYTLDDTINYLLGYDNTGISVGTNVSTASTANAIVRRDASKNIAANGFIGGVVSSNTAQFYKSSVTTAYAASGTLLAADLIAGFIQFTTNVAGVTLTFPTGTVIETAVSAYVTPFNGLSFNFTFWNFNVNAVTLASAAGIGFQLMSTSQAGQSSKTYKLIRTALNNYTVYNLS